MKKSMLILVSGLFAIAIAGHAMPALAGSHNPNAATGIGKDGTPPGKAKDKAAGETGKDHAPGQNK